MFNHVRPSDQSTAASEAPHPEDELGYFATLKAGVAEAVSSPAVRGLVLAAGVLEGLDPPEEYFTLLAEDWGVSTGWCRWPN